MQNIHLFKIIGTSELENVKLIQNYVWNTLEIYWKEVYMVFNGNKINLLKFVMIQPRDKFKIRHMMKRESLLFHVMLKQGITRFTLASNSSPIETV